MPARKTPEKLYTMLQVEELLHISRVTLYRLMALGKSTKGKEGIYPWFYITSSKRGTRFPESAILRLQNATHCEA